MLSRRVVLSSTHALTLAPRRLLSNKKSPPPGFDEMPELNRLLKEAFKAGSSLVNEELARFRCHENPTFSSDLQRFFTQVREVHQQSSMVPNNYDHPTKITCQSDLGSMVVKVEFQTDPEEFDLETWCRNNN